MAFDLEKIAELARLKVCPEEKGKLGKEIQAILAYVEQLGELNVDQVEPTSHVLDLENVFRPDEVCPSNVRDEALKHAPLADGSFFKVPKIVDKEE